MEQQTAQKVKTAFQAHKAVEIASNLSHVEVSRT